MELQTDTAAARGTEASRFGRPASAPADGVYVLDARRSKLGFRAKAFCLKWVTGTLGPTSGEVIIEGGIVRGHGTADAAAVDTGIKPRDWHLRTSHYLHTAKYPAVRLRVERCDLDSRQAEARLEVRDGVVLIPITIDEVRTQGDELRLKISGSFDRRGLGMLPRLAGVSRMVHLDLDLVATRS
jgi:polyisoprenoid-binding protein YceI